MAEKADVQMEEAHVETEEVENLKCCPCPWNSKCLKCVCAQADGCRPSCNSRKCTYKNVAGLPATTKGSKTEPSGDISRPDDDKNADGDAEAVIGLVQHEVDEAAEEDKMHEDGGDGSIETKPESIEVATESGESVSINDEQEMEQELTTKIEAEEEKDVKQSEENVEAKEPMAVENSEIHSSPAPAESGETVGDSSTSLENDVHMDSAPLSSIVKSEGIGATSESGETAADQDVDSVVKKEEETDGTEDALMQQAAMKLEIKEVPMHSQNDSQTEIKAEDDAKIAENPEANIKVESKTEDSVAGKHTVEEKKPPRKTSVRKKSSVSRTTKDKKTSKNEVKKSTQVKKETVRSKREVSESSNKDNDGATVEEQKKEMTEDTSSVVKEEPPEPFMPDPLDFIDDLTSDMVFRTIRIGPLVLEDLENEELFGCLQVSRQFTLNVFNTVLSDAKDDALRDAHDKDQVESEEAMQAKTSETAKSDTGDASKDGEDAVMNSSEVPGSTGVDDKVADEVTVQEKSEDVAESDVVKGDESKVTVESIEGSEKEEGREMTGEDSKPEETDTADGRSDEASLQPPKADQPSANAMETNQDEEEQSKDEQPQTGESEPSQPSPEQKSSDPVTDGESKQELPGESQISDETPGSECSGTDKGMDQSSEEQEVKSTTEPSKSSDASNSCCILIKKIPDDIAKPALETDGESGDLSGKKVTLKDRELALHKAVSDVFKSYGRTVKVGVFGLDTEAPYSAVKYYQPEAAARALKDGRNGVHWGHKLDVEYHTNAEAMMPVPFDPAFSEYHKQASRVLQVHFSGDFEGGGDVDKTTNLLRSLFRPYGVIQHVSIRLGWMRLLMDAYVKYTDISSVITALKSVNVKQIGYEGVVMGFGKALPSQIVWVGGLDDTATEEELHEVFSLYGSIVYCHCDSIHGHALIYYNKEASATAAISSLRGETIAGKRIQIDYSHLYCENQFFRRMIQTGQLTREEVPSWVGVPSSCVYGSMAPAIVSPDRRFVHKETGDKSKEVLDEYCSEASRILYIGEFDKKEEIDVKELEKMCAAYGRILAVDVKKQSFSDYSFILVEYTNITSVVHAMQDLDQKIFGKKRKLMFARSPRTRCVWLGNVGEFITEKDIKHEFNRHEYVSHVVIDRALEEALVFFDAKSKTKSVVSQWRRQWLMRGTIQVDFASRHCRLNFMERKKDPKRLWSHPAWIKNDDDTVYSYIDAEFFTSEDLQACLEILSTCAIGVRPIVTQNIDAELADKIALSYELDQMKTFEKKTLKDITSSNIVSLPGIPLDVTEEEIKDKVAYHVESVFIPRTSEGISKGYSYVEITEGKVRDVIGKRVRFGEDEPRLKIVALGERQSSSARSSDRSSRGPRSTASHDKFDDKRKPVHSRLGMRSLHVRSRLAPASREQRAAAVPLRNRSEDMRSTLRRPALLRDPPARAPILSQPVPVLGRATARSQGFVDRKTVADRRRTAVALAVRRQQEAQRRAEEQAKREQDMAYNYALIQREEEERRRIMELRREQMLEEHARAHRMREHYSRDAAPYQEMAQRQDPLYALSHPAPYAGHGSHDSRYVDAQRAHWRQAQQARYDQTPHDGYPQPSHYPVDHRYPQAEHAMASYAHAPARMEPARTVPAKPHEYKPVAYDGDHWPRGYQSEKPEARSHRSDPTSFDFGMSNSSQGVARHHADARDLDPLWRSGPTRGGDNERRAEQDPRQQRNRDHGAVAVRHDDRVRDQRGIPDPGARHRSDSRLHQSRDGSGPSPRHDRREPSPRIVKRSNDPSPRHRAKGRELSPRQIKRDRSPRHDRKAIERSPRFEKKGREPSPRRGRHVKSPSPRFSRRAKSPSPRPVKKAKNLSPRHDTRISPRRERRVRDPSPRRGRSPSPRRGRNPVYRSPSPKRRSPPYKRSPSPKRGRGSIHHRSRSPVYKRSPSPRRGKSPAYRRSPSPRRGRSPFYKRSPSPKRGRSPGFRRSPSPKRKASYRERSPIDRRSPSPMRGKSGHGPRGDKSSRSVRDRHHSRSRERSRERHSSDRNMRDGGGGSQVDPVAAVNLLLGLSSLISSQNDGNKKGGSYSHR